MDKGDLKALREAILRQAGPNGSSGWLPLPIPAKLHVDGVLPVPRGAFEQWAVRKSNGGHLATPWHPVSPQGLKQGADDPFHTDWILGAGLALDAMHSSNASPAARLLGEAAYREAARVAERLLGHDSTVLLQGPEVRGIVLSPQRPGEVAWDEADGEPPVLVLRDASPDWLEDVSRALAQGGAVVVERGGGTAHLVSEMRGEGAGPILRKPDARRLFPQGANVNVYPQNGTLRLVEGTYLPRVPASMFPVLPSQVRAEASARTKGRFTDNRNKPVVVNLWDGKGSKPGDEYSRMEPVYKLQGREWQVHASYQWNKDGTGYSEQPMALVMYVSPMTGHEGERRIAWVPPRIWASGDLLRACREALEMAVPAEAYNSPESQAAREEIFNQEHAWWLRPYADKSNEELVERCRAELADRNVLLAGDMDDPRVAEIVVATDERAYPDAVANSSWMIRHFDIEFERRGMEERSIGLEPLESVQEVMAPAP